MSSQLDAAVARSTALSVLRSRFPVATTPQTLLPARGTETFPANRTERHRYVVVNDSQTARLLLSFGDPPGSATDYTTSLAPQERLEEDAGVGLVFDGLVTGCWDMPDAAGAAYVTEFVLGLFPANALFL